MDRACKSEDYFAGTMKPAMNKFQVIFDKSGHYRIARIIRSDERVILALCEYFDYQLGDLCVFRKTILVIYL